MPARPLRPDRILVRERNVGDGDRPRAAIDFRGVTEAVAERVELLDIVEIEAGLRFDRRLLSRLG